MFSSREIDNENENSDSEDSNFAEEDELTRIIPPAGQYNKKKLMSKN